MPKDAKREMDLLALWQDKMPNLDDAQINAVASKGNGIVSACVTANQHDVFMKLRFADGADSTIVINPAAAKNVGMLLLKAVNAMGWAEVSILVDQKTQH